MSIKLKFRELENENEANFERWRTQAAEYRKAEAGCKLLTGSDRVLMEMYIKGDCNYHQLSKLLGRSYSSVIRRIRQLTAIIQGQSGKIVRFQGTLKPVEATVARLAMVQRLSRRQIALRTGLSQYRVNLTCQKLGIITQKSHPKTSRIMLRRQ